MHGFVSVMAEGEWHARVTGGGKRNTVPIGMGHPARPDLAALVPPFHP